MVTKELSEVAVEINCILSHSSQEIINKIPATLITFLKNIASTTYTFNYDNSKTLNEQNIKPGTRGLIALIYQDYICNKEEKRNYILKRKNYEIEKNNELRKKYSPDNIFNEKQKKTIESKVQQNQLIAYKESILKKALDKIRSILKISLYTRIEYSLDKLSEIWKS